MGLPELAKEVAPLAQGSPPKDLTLCRWQRGLVPLWGDSYGKGKEEYQGHQVFLSSIIATLDYCQTFTIPNLPVAGSSPTRRL